MTLVLLLLAAWLTINVGLLATALVLDRLRQRGREAGPAARAGAGTVVPLAGR